MREKRISSVGLLHFGQGLRKLGSRQLIRSQLSPDIKCLDKGGKIKKPYKSYLNLDFWRPNDFNDVKSSGAETMHYLLDM